MPPSNHTSDDFDDLGQQLQAALARKSDALLPAVAKVFKRDAQRWKTAMVKRMRGERSLGSAKGADEDLATRSGALRRSLFGRVLGTDLDSLALIKGSTSNYARIHELGTVGAGGELPDIVPVRKKWLAIPTEKALTPSGVPQRAGPRQWDLRFVLMREDLALLISKGEGRSPSEVLYILKKKVAIPPRMGMVETHEKHARLRRRDMHKAIAEVLAA